MRFWAAAVLLLLVALPPPAHAEETSAARAQVPAAALALELACPKCHHVNRAAARFCAECGTLLHPGDCPRCGSPLVAGEKFCTQCGLDVSTIGLKRADDKAGDGMPGSENPPLPPVGKPGAQGEPGPVMEDLGRGGLPTFNIRWFSDVDLRGSNLAHEHTSFALGQLDTFVTSRLSDRASVLTEVVTKATPENTFQISIERLFASYSVADWLNVSAGRFHTDIGYYNTAYHHSAWMQTTVGRPFPFAFEGDGGPLPSHTVGLELDGSIPSGSLNAHYNLEVGNGRTSRSSTAAPVQSLRDENNGKSVNLAVKLRPDALPGLQTGASLYHDSLYPDGFRRIEQYIPDVYAVYSTPNFEWLNEAVLIHHSSSRGMFTGDANTVGGYTQISRLWGKTRPYFRFEYMNSPLRDPILRDIGLRYGPTVGVRYDLEEFLALKLEYEHTQRKPFDSFDQFTFQAAFTF